MVFDTCVVDAKNLAYRVAWVFRELHDKSSRGTGISFGTVQNLIGLKQRFAIRRFVFLWDSITNWRVDKYPWYKAGRTEKPAEDFLRQLSVLQNRLLPIIGVNQVVAVSYEADDLAAWWVRHSENSTLLVSNDHDWQQLLIRDNVQLFRPSAQRVSTRSNIYEEWGLWPEELPAVWSITGCDSDSVPGIRRFPEKEAARIVRDCLRGGHTVRNSWDAVLREQFDVFLRNWELIFLSGRVSDIVGTRSCLDQARFAEFCEEFNMKTLTPKFSML